MTRFGRERTDMIQNIPPQTHVSVKNVAQYLATAAAKELALVYGI